MFIIYFYILTRYLIVLGLIITSIVFFIKTIKKKRLIFSVGIIVPYIIIALMFTYGTVRKPAIDIKDLCINFDKIYNEDIIECDSFYIAFMQLTVEDAYESIEDMKKEEKLLSGTVDDVQYLATYMYSDMLDFENLGTYCGTYEGQILLTKGDKTIDIYYTVCTSQKDPRAIFYSFKPQKIEISDYIQSENQGTVSVKH